MASRSARRDRCSGRPRRCRAAGRPGPPHTREMHGKTGLDGADIPGPTRSAIETHAVDLIIALAEQHRGELVVAAIGPNTNLALALKREPRLRSWLREVTIMGGSATLATVTPVAES